MDMDITVSNATEADLDAVSAVEGECFPAAEAADRETFAERLRVYPEHFYLAFPGERLVAFVDGSVTDEKDLTDEMYENVSLHDEKGRWQMIFGVNTVPEYRRRGIAGELIKRVISDAREQGRDGVVLTCKERLIHYYEKFGFKSEGVTDKSTHGNVEWYQMRHRF